MVGYLNACVPYRIADISPLRYASSAILRVLVCPPPSGRRARTGVFQGNTRVMGEETPVPTLTDTQPHRIHVLAAHALVDQQSNPTASPPQQ